MTTLNRRTFVHLSTGAMLTAASRKLFGSTEAPSISSQGGEVRVQGANYTWEYSQAEDTFRLRDSRKRLIVSGKLQPAVVVAPAQDAITKAMHSWQGEWLSCRTRSCDD